MYQMLRVSAQMPKYDGRTTEESKIDLDGKASRENDICLWMSPFESSCQ